MCYTRRPPEKGVPVSLDPTPLPEPSSLLRQDIRLLGKTLGEVLRECEGRPVYDVVEKLRRTAVRFRREGQDRDGRILAQQIRRLADRSEEHTSELQSIMRISYAVFCLKKQTSHK